MIAEQNGYSSFRVRGERAERIFKNEAGIHRFQRVPPTERRGRTHTSILTVCALEESKNVKGFNGRDIEKRFLDYSFYRSRGPGGQHKNKTFSAVRLKHIPTGIVVHAQFGRSQTKNKETALQILKVKLEEQENRKDKKKRNKDRRSQVGRGSRGEYVRTYNVKKDLVINHVTGRRQSFKRFTRGHLEI